MIIILNLILVKSEKFALGHKLLCDIVLTVTDPAEIYEAIALVVELWSHCWVDVILGWSRHWHAQFTLAVGSRKRLFVWIEKLVIAVDHQILIVHLKWSIFLDHLQIAVLCNLLFHLRIFVNLVDIEVSHSGPVHHFWVLGLCHCMLLNSQLDIILVLFGWQILDLHHFILSEDNSIKM